MDREDLPRVSVGSLTDWERVRNSYTDSALSALRTALDSQDLHQERDAIHAHFNHFIDSTFSMAQANLRVNGHNFESIDRAAQDMEAFDEVLDRRIWSLADTRLQWHKRMAKTRREAPREIQARLSGLFDKSLTQDQSISEVDDTASHANEAVDDPQPVALQAVEEFQMTTAITQELDQNIPSQQERVHRAEKATTQLRSMRY